MESSLFQAQSTSIKIDPLSLCTDHVYILDNITGTIVCSECGLVKDLKPISHNLSIKKDFQQPGFQKNSRNISCKPQGNLKRALKLNNNIKWDKKRNIIGEKEILRIVSTNEFNKNIEDRAKYLLKKSLNHPAFRGQYIGLIAEVCVYYSCKYTNFPCSLEDIINLKKYTTNLGLKYYSKLMQVLKLPHPRLNPYNMMNNCCSKLDLNQETTQLSQKIIDLYFQHHISGGYQLKGIVGGSIYIACLMKRIPRSQQIIAKSIGVSDITIRARFRVIQLLCKKYPIDF